MTRIRPGPPRRLTLTALALVACLFSVVLVDAAPIAAQSQAGLTVTPQTLSIPVGSRACYVIWPNTNPTSEFTITQSGSTGYATHVDVSSAEVFQPNTSNTQAGGVYFCLKGKVATTSAITFSHTVQSSDSNYNGITVPAATVSVVAADTTPTIRFLYPEMWVVEGSTNLRNIRSVDELDVRTVTIKLDIAPAPSRNGNVIWHVPYPDCHTVGHRSNLNLSRPVGCVDGWQPGDPAAGYARYNVDYIPDGLMGRHVAFTSGSNDMQFTFDIRSDNVAENREWVQVYLTNQEFTPAVWPLFRKNTDVCVGACTNPSQGDQSVVVRIVDDDTSTACTYCGTMGEPGKIRDPEFVEIEPTPDEVSGQQLSATSNAPPTVSNAISDATIVNQAGTHKVSLSGVFDDADGDDLTITASSSKESVATVSVSADYTSLTVNAKSRGTAKITVTAADGKGGTVSDEFTVKVKAAPRKGSNLQSAIGLEVGLPPLVTSLSGVFIDDDGDALSITASSDDEAVATVSIDSSSYTVKGVSAGKTKIKITAEDTDGNKVTYSFDVSVTEPPQSDPPLIVLLVPPPKEEAQNQQQETPAPESEDEDPENEETEDLNVSVNSAPSVASALPDVNDLREGATLDISLSGVFDDVDGDALTITASSDYEDVVKVSVASDYSDLTLTADNSGDATITVVAQDPDGNQASLTFKVEVTDPATQSAATEQQTSEKTEPDKQEQETTTQPETAATSEPETETEETATVTSETESETETEEAATSDAVARYDTNNDGTIDKSEFNQAANDHFDGKITYAEFVEIYTAYNQSSV